jgi:hypothetical protein
MVLIDSYVGLIEPQKLSRISPRLRRQQRLGYLLPFRIEGFAANRLAGAPIPIGGIAGIALLAVEIGVNPIGGAAFVALRQLMGAIEIAAPVMPERFQRRAEARGRGRGGKRLAEGGEVHGILARVVDLCGNLYVDRNLFTQSLECRFDLVEPRGVIQPEKAIN